MYTVTRYYIYKRVASVAGVAMPNYLHVSLDPTTLLRFGTTAAACGLTIKAATAEAVAAWVDAHSDAVRAIVAGKTSMAPVTNTTLKSPPTAVIAELPPAKRAEVPLPAPGTSQAYVALPTADEILRAQGHPGFQRGIPLRASAILKGEAAVAAKSE
jgi:hypothetical protein